MSVVFWTRLRVDAIVQRINFKSRTVIKFRKFFIAINLSFEIFIKFWTAITT